MLEKLTSLQAYFPTPPRDKLGHTPLFGFGVRVAITQVKPVVQLSGT